MSKIEWTDETWNPWRGCDKIAPECDQCYAAAFASRNLQPAHHGVAVGGEWTGVITRATPTVCAQPAKWARFGRIKRVFTCSMTDFWHENVPLPWLERLWRRWMQRRPGLSGAREAPG